MAGKNEWEIFFDAHAPVYMENVFTKNTVEEVNFILEELKLPPGSHILDVGCGTGRHSVELAKRGYKVTGIDISSGMLSEAKKAAKKARVNVEWIHTDASKFTSSRSFDASICLCEGAFGLLGKDDDPMQHELSILRNINAVLKPDKKLILTALNGFRMIREHSQEDVERGQFDPITLIEVSLQECDTAQGRKSVWVKERGFIPTELAILLGQAGFKVENIWGGTAGNWGRRKVDLDEMEVMVIARKVGNLT
jgi:cyclopropane fatty-acyl-phospholipid synthase-like methyltransferase